MTKTKKIVVNPIDEYSKRHKRKPMDQVPECENVTERVYRPARRLGRLIRNEMIDGVKSNAARLLQNQYDDTYGTVDPLSDIHTDRFELADALMRDGRKSLAETTKELSKTTQTEEAN